MIQTILYATDLGWFSPHIMQHVVTLAEKFDAKVVVVHAIEPFGLLGSGSAVVKSFIAEDLLDDEDSRLERMKSEIKNRVVDSYAEEYMLGEAGLATIKDVIIEQGHPADVILNEAINQCADMIVMGRHGQHAIDPNLLGSVTSKVLQLAKIPVYMVPVMKPMVIEKRGISFSLKP